MRLIDADALPNFPTMLRKMWSGGEVQQWIEENITNAPTVEREGWKLLPIEPTKEMLACIGWNKYPQDWERGKELQKLKGLEVVPPNCEYEIAVGQYERLLEATPPIRSE